MTSTPLHLTAITFTTLPNTRLAPCTNPSTCISLPGSPATSAAPQRDTFWVRAARCALWSATRRKPPTGRSGASDLRRGDLTDAAALAAALDGAAGAFVMQPTPSAVAPDFPEAQALTAGIREALRRAPPLRVVALSSVGSEQTSGLGNITQTHLLEEALGNLDGPLAFIRAGSLFENYAAGIDRAGATGWFDSFLQPTDRAFPMTATEDIGAEVARLLTGDWTGGRIIELGSRTSPDALARAMGDVLGRPVRARAIPRDEWSGRLSAMGFPAEKARMWEEMQDGFNSRWIDFGRPGTEAIAGTTTPAEVFARAMHAQHAPTESDHADH